MKKWIAICCILLCAALLFTMTATAARVPLDTPEVAVYAVVSLTDGEEKVVDSAPDAAVMEGADAYALYVEDAPVLSVEHLLSGVGEPVAAEPFYSVNFTFAGTDTEVFLTGLRADQVAEVQQRIIDSYVRGSSFELTDLGFIDAEKTFNEDNDDELCWAASTSDMLTYTGWAAQAGFESEDDVFEAHIDAFENTGGHQFYAIGWFFDGCVLHDNSGNYGARAVDYPNSGGYLRDYAFDRYVTNGSFTVNDMDKVAALLRAGCAVGFGAYIYYDGAYDNAGHAMTMWGYVVDNSMPADDPSRYLSICITDSDSDELEDADRRDAVNVMSVYALDPYEGYYWFDFDEHTSALITDYVSLAPYRAELPRETDPDANKDKITRPDLSVSEMYLSDNGSTRELKTLFESGSTVSFTYRIDNFSDQSYSGLLYTQATMTDALGNVIFDSTPRYRISNLPIRGGTVPNFLSAADLPEGDYTLTFTVNPNHSAAEAMPEAYYYNNTKTLSFRVRDSYLRGDYDGNGEVNILDATKIQRALAGYTTNLDDRASVRGDVNCNGLNVIDATLVQRHLAGFSTPDPLGEKQLYD